ncbi:MAG: sugar porter family MFS transporter [Bryobacterales bacterium]|nr:sugar porter family MFS transporter [Bryobacterales bacterium]
MPEPYPRDAETSRQAGAATTAGSRTFLYFVSLVAATSGLLFGFDIAVINGAILFLREEFALSEFQTEAAASNLLFGCVLGAIVAGILSDRFGRRRVLLLAAALFGLSALGAALPRNLWEFGAARFAGGVAIGVAALLAPLYIAEIAPARIRGRLVALNQMAIVTGILLAYFVNWTLSFGGGKSWRWMFAVAAVPSLAFFIALFFVPESPRWLVEIGREEEAFRVLARVSGAASAEEELPRIRDAITEESGTLRQLFQPGYRRALAIAVGLAILQQITGINTVLCYGSILFKEHLGNTDNVAIGANVTIGAVNFLATFVALWWIDRAGRKTLLMLSAGGMAFCQLALGFAFQQQPPSAWVVLPLVLGCVAAFAVGIGPATWVVLSEIFPTRIRGRAMGIATVALWIACIVLTMTYLTLVRVAGVSGAFWIYGSICVFTFLFVWRMLPETKGKTLEEIEQNWRT